MKKEVMRKLSLMNAEKYDDDNFYFVFFDYNEGERVIINNKYAKKIIDICLNEKECRFINEYCFYYYKQLHIFTRILNKYNIEYKTEWFDIEH